MNPHTLLDSASEAYAKWGIPNVEGLTRESFANLLQSAEPRLREAVYRLVPSTFEADDPLLHAFPRPFNYQWASCERLLRHFGVQGVMLRTPIFWHLGLPLHDACRSVGIPIFANEPENIPVGAIALTGNGIDTVVTDNRDASAFASYLAQKSLPSPKLWVLIHRADSSDWDVAEGVLNSPAVAQEVHLFPSLVLLEQCPFLADKTQRFHFSDTIVAEIEPGALYVSSAGNDPLPLYRFRVPLALSTRNGCPCGRQIVERV